MIRINHLNKKFKKLIALNNITLQFDEGQVVSLIGPNGSGKTTLIKTILGLVKPDSGQIYFRDKNIKQEGFTYRNEIGYMPQIGRYPENMTIGQLFSLLKNIRNKDENSLDYDLLKQYNLVSMYDKPMRTLSGGTRQKVSAAIAFLFRPPVLILDEPTAGLDPLSSEVLKEKILQTKKEGTLILISSHILSDLDDLTTDVMYLQDGKMKFFKNLATIQEDTGEIKLGKAIARLMKGEDPAANMISEILKTNR